MQTLFKTRHPIKGVSVWHKHRGGVRNNGSSIQPRHSTSRTVSASCVGTGNWGPSALSHSLITWNSRNCSTSVSHSLVISRQNSTEMPIPQSPWGKLNSQNIQIHEGLCHVSAISAMADPGKFSCQNSQQAEEFGKLLNKMCIRYSLTNLSVCSIFKGL